MRPGVFILLIALNCPGEIFSKDQSGMNVYPRTFTVIDASPTGRTLRLDRGYFDNIRVGDKGEFYSGYEQAQLIGYGEAVKVDNSTSYWFFKKVVIGGNFLKGKKTIYFTTGGNRRVISKDLSKEKDDIEYIEREFY